MRFTPAAGSSIKLQVLDSAVLGVVEPPSLLARAAVFTVKSLVWAAACKELTRCSGAPCPEYC